MLIKPHLKYIIAGLMISSGLVYFFMPRNDGASDFILPQLTAKAQMGQSAFNQNCAACHGKNARGSQNGPPLVHIIYEPNHHSDASFYRAVQSGVRAHHWRYGNMPPLPHLKQSDMSAIITYVRELQRANGIF